MTTIRSRRSTLLVRVALAIAMLGTYACTRDDRAGARRHQEPVPAPAQPLDEASAVHVLRTLNDNEIELARLAHDRATNPDVREFAEMMMHDHGAARARVDAWAASENVTASANDVSGHVTTEAAQVRQRLEALPQGQFDHAYIESQVEMHRDALATLDTRLVPGAQHPDFRALLGSLRTDIARHLAEASTIADGLPG
jgi:putative membrane protein